MLLTGAAAAQSGVADQSRREAAGWLELEQDQRSYRERVEPLDLREERSLETIERRQRLDLRVLQQRQRRELEQQEDLRRRRAPASGEGLFSPPRGALDARQRRQLERQRLDRQMEQRRLPFGRR